MMKTEQTSSAASPRKNVSKLVSELETAGALWRSERVRKKPTNVYIPATWGQQETRKKLVYECKCFLCGKGRGVKSRYIDEAGKETELEYGELIGCSRCPKAYHKICEGIKEEKKTWTCRWHECCLCFRKASQCGNLLIHCAKCPCSFCYDCFPPDYTRCHVGEDYYHQLRQRGANMKESNWIMFLCARCKALDEQTKRRDLSRAELDDQRTKQKELRSQLVESSVKETKHPSPEQQHKIATRRTQIDAIEVLLENQLRESYEGLYPADLVTCLKEHKQKADQEKLVARSTTSRPGDKKKPTIPRILLPRELVKLCPNCHLPGHISVDQCPFPLETVMCRAPVAVSYLELDKDGKPATDYSDSGSLSLHNRSFCSLCGVGQKGRMGHVRKHCDKLKESDMQEYDKRHEQQRRLISRLQQTTPVSLTNSLQDIIRAPLQVVRSMSNTVFNKVAVLLSEAMSEVGLGSCLAAQPRIAASNGFFNLGSHLRSFKSQGLDSPMTISSTNTPPSEPVTPGHVLQQAPTPHPPPHARCSDQRRIPKTKPPPPPPVCVPPKGGQRIAESDESGDDIDDTDSEKMARQRTKRLLPHHLIATGLSPTKRRMMDDEGLRKYKGGRSHGVDETERGGTEEKGSDSRSRGGDKRPISASHPYACGGYIVGDRRGVPPCEYSDYYRASDIRHYIKGPYMPSSQDLNQHSPNRYQNYHSTGHRSTHGQPTSPHYNRLSQSHRHPFPPPYPPHGVVPPPPLDRNSLPRPPYGPPYHPQSHHHRGYHKHTNHSSCRTSSNRRSPDGTMDVAKAGRPSNWDIRKTDSWETGGPNGRKSCVESHPS